MGKLGLPVIEITFSETASTLTQRGERGVVGLILQSGVTADPFDAMKEGYPKNITNENKMCIELAKVGYVNPPKKVLVYLNTADNYEGAKKYFETHQVDYLAIPQIPDGLLAEFANWAKGLRAKNKKTKLVMPNYAGDSVAIINVAAGSYTFSGYDAVDEKIACARVAGLIAGTPITMACTYAPLYDMTDCTRYDNEELGEMIGDGKFVFMHDGEKVKIARGVNSLTTTTADMGDSFKKIKVVEAMDMIQEDLTTLGQDTFIGKYSGKYDNKILLIRAISAYFESIPGVVEKFEIGIDIEANKRYLIAKGIDVDAMSDDEIKRANTGDKVYLYAKITILDAIEEIYLPIEM